MLCTSCKNKTSNERCTNKVIRGFLFCGKHVRNKNPRIWLSVNNLDKKVILIQKIWRGYSIREWIKLAGPGVLKRSLCHNEEELVTLDNVQSVSPLDYFAFEESKKIYWFDIRSINEHCMTTLTPSNPYTREPLSIETRQRLHKLCIKREIYNLKLIFSDHMGKTADEIIENAWIKVCQIIEENGFFGVLTPMYFISLNEPQLLIFMMILRQDIVAWAMEHSMGGESRRYMYVRWIRRLISQYYQTHSLQKMLHLTATLLINILNDRQNNYPICFMVMSALYRL
jgi:hypothetical protein